MLYKGEFSNHNMITWLINKECNYHCEYCTQSHNKPKKSKPLDLSLLAESLKYLNRDWLFHITGGEPFLEKNFIAICREIIKKHYISINTNLSTSNVLDFADNIDPNRTLFINAAVHIKEREKYDSKLNSYIDKIIYLQTKGFNVIAYYVAHPELFHRIQTDISYLKSKGVKKIRIKIFKGIFKGDYYPNSFNPKEIEFIESLEADYPEFEILRKPPKYYGQLCLAGKKFFTMDRNGNIRRCSSLNRDYGNLFNGKVAFDLNPRPCPIKVCGCQYEGIRNVLSLKGNLASVLKEDIVEKSFKLKQLLKNPRLLKNAKSKIILYYAQKHT